MTELPNDIEQLKAMLLKLQEENQYKDEAIATLEKTIQSQAEEVIELENKMPFQNKPQNIIKKA